MLITCSWAAGQGQNGCDPKRFSDSLLDNLTGQWDLTGKIMGRDVRNHFSAEWTLEHQFLELNFVDAVTPPSYSARVFIGYDCTSERYVVHWLDIFGGRVSDTLGYGTKSGQEYTFRFEYPEGPFINQLSYDPKLQSWHFHMTNKNPKGEWTVFADEYLAPRK
jgi:hypothetical protein